MALNLVQLTLFRYYLPHIRSRFFKLINLKTEKKVIVFSSDDMILASTIIFPFLFILLFRNFYIIFTYFLNNFY